MNKIVSSPLTQISFNTVINSDVLKLWNPENNQFSDVYIGVSTKPIEIHDILQTVKHMNIQNRNTKNNSIAGYKHWHDREWYTSLDYYVSSNTIKHEIHSKHILKCLNLNNPLQNDIHVVSSKNIKVVYSIPNALKQRRTCRQFKKTLIKKERLWNILIDSLDEVIGAKKLTLVNGFSFYCVIFSVEDLDKGLYFYDPAQHTLGLMNAGDFSERISEYIQGLQAPKTAAFTMFITANFNALQRAMPNEKGLRAAYIESGRIAQKIIIAAMQYNLYCLSTPAISDRAVTKFLHLQEPAQAPLYSLTFGEK